jgi:hypothetical protein
VKTTVPKRVRLPRVTPTPKGVRRHVPRRGGTVRDVSLKAILTAHHRRNGY